MFTSTTSADEAVTAIVAGNGRSAMRSNMKRSVIPHPALAAASATSAVERGWWSTGFDIASCPRLEHTGSFLRPV